MKRRVAAAAAGLAIAGAALFAATRPTSTTPPRALRPSPSASPTAAPSVLPEQLKPTQILCVLTLSDTFDTIVAKGQKPFGHLHDFYGNLKINENSEYETLVGQPTSCAADEPKDTAVYWVPGLLVNGVKQTPNPGLRVYYARPDNNLSGSGKKTFPIDKPFPPDFRMIVGNGSATSVDQNAAFVAGRVDWFCYDEKHNAGSNAPPPTNCKTIGGERMDIYLTFPSCWVGTLARPGDVVSKRPGYEGQVIDSSDHKSHVAYPANKTGACPATHPVRLPQLKFQVIFRSYDGVTSFTSGPWASWHGDFLNSWDQPRLEEIVELANAGG